MAVSMRVLRVFLHSHHTSNLIPTSGTCVGERKWSGTGSGGFEGGWRSSYTGWFRELCLPFSFFFFFFFSFWLLLPPLYFLSFHFLPFCPLLFFCFMLVVLFLTSFSFFFLSSLPFLFFLFFRSFVPFFLFSLLPAPFRLSSFFLPLTCSFFPI